MSFSDFVLSRVHPVMWKIDAQLRVPVWKHIFSVPSKSFTYFRIPKAANSAIVIALQKHLPDKGNARTAKRLGRQFARSGIWTTSQFSRHFTFTFVRNPFARVLSCYLDKVHDGDPKYAAMLGLVQNDMRFIDFLKRLDQGHLLQNIHWAPQAALIPMSPEKLDFVGRVENIDQDLPVVLERIFGKVDHDVPASPYRTTSAGTKLSQYYGMEEIALVRKLYAEDFALFYPEAENPVPSPGRSP